MKIGIQNNKAFTLTEAVVTIFIFLLILTGLYSSTLTGEKAWAKNKIKIELQQEVRKAAARIKLDLTQSGSGAISDVDVDGTAYDEITFQVASGTSVTGNVVWSSTSINYALAADGSNQLIRNEGGNLLVVARNISSIDFERNVSDIVEVSILAEDPDAVDNPITFNLDFDVHLRN